MFVGLMSVLPGKIRGYCFYTTRVMFLVNKDFLVG